MRKTTSLLLILLLLASEAQAVQTELAWTQNAETNCIGGTLPNDGQFDAVEIFISDRPITASDVSCWDSISDIDPRPEGTTVFAPSAEDIANGSMEINLLGGFTYYVRVRTRFSTPQYSQWSNLSGQSELFVPHAPVHAPTIIRFQLK